MAKLPPFKFAPRDAEAVKIRIAAVEKLIRCIVAADVPKEEKLWLLRFCFWRITEANGKHNLRFKSKNVRKAKNTSEVHHEHVWSTNFLRNAVLTQPPEMIGHIIEHAAIACVVTKKEHAKLDHGEEGWEKYKKAGIMVVDTLTMKPHVFP